MKKCIVMLSMMSTIAHAEDTASELVTALSKCARYIQRATPMFKHWASVPMDEVGTGAAIIELKNTQTRYNKILDQLAQNKHVFTQEQSKEVTKHLSDIMMAREEIDSYLQRMTNRLQEVIAFEERMAAIESVNLNNPNSQFIRHIWPDPILLINRVEYQIKPE